MPERENNVPHVMRAQSVEALFAALTSADIHRWIAERRAEDLTLDFKTAPRCFEQAEERKVLARAISGFANSSGGLIVWGVIAKRTVDGIDGADAPEPISDMQRFVTNLQRYSGSAVSPTVPGVVHRATDSGEFAITLVPQGELPPYMAKLGEDRYFKRSGDSFYRMEHFDLADMFGRRRSPRLELRLDGVREALVIRRDNVSRISARAPFVYVKTQPQFVIGSGGVDGHGTWPIRREGNNKYESAFVGGADFIVHPGRTIDVALLHWEPTPQRPRPIGDFVVSFELATEEIPLQQLDYLIEVSDTGVARLVRTERAPAGGR
jgi:hypothetical protein